MNATVAMACSRVRVEEKLLLDAYARRGVEVRRVDPRALSLPLGGTHTDPTGTDPTPALQGVTVLHDRGISYGVSCHLLEALAARGIACVNTPDVVRTCGDKVLASLRLDEAGVPQPETRLAFSSEEALRLLDEELGYPAVLKPAVGSWGRLVARLNDRHAAEAVLEDREVLGSWPHRSLYLQALVAKPGRDLRVFVIDGEPVAAIWRHSDHWVTNTARGGSVSACAVEAELGELAVAAAAAVGGGILAVDLVEHPDRGLLVLEVNHGGEFRNSIEPTGVDLPGLMVDHVLAVAARTSAVLAGAATECA